LLKFYKKDFSEILIGFTVLSTGDVKERLKFLFRVYDQNNDGYIDLDELRTALRVIIFPFFKLLNRSDWVGSAPGHVIIFPTDIS
jgi:Ca2+-binding EF-hand superfamily protein